MVSSIFIIMIYGTHYTLKTITGKPKKNNYNNINNLIIVIIVNLQYK